MSLLKKKVRFVILSICLMFSCTLCTSAIENRLADNVGLDILDGNSSIFEEILKTKVDNKETEEQRICETVEELLYELDKDIGGEIVLSGDKPFVIKDDYMYFIEIYVTKPTTVYMPEGGIELEEYMSLTISGPITFTGTKGFVAKDFSYISFVNGVSIILESTDNEQVSSGINLKNYVTLETDSTVNICAVGDNGITILCETNCTLNLEYSTINAIGNNSTVISGGENLKINKAHIEANGSDSKALYSDSNIELVLSFIIGDIQADMVYSVTNYFSDQPQNLTELSIEDDQLDKSYAIYEDLAYGSKPIEFPSDITYYYSYSALDPEAIISPFVTLDCIVTWDLSSLDYSTPGEYKVTAQLEPMVPIPDFSLPPITYNITVVSKDRAAIYGSLRYELCVMVKCIAPIDDADEILFWIYEEDSGWRELTSTGNAVFANEWNPNMNKDMEFSDEYPMFEILGLEEMSSYWVMVQVIGGPMEGNSNIWKLYTRSENGGDRTGTDRGGVNPPKFETDSETNSNNLPESGNLPNKSDNNSTDTDNDESNENSNTTSEKNGYSTDNDITPNKFEPKSDNSLDREIISEKENFAEQNGYIQNQINNNTSPNNTSSYNTENNNVVSETPKEYSASNDNTSSKIPGQSVVTDDNTSTNNDLPVEDSKEIISSQPDNKTKNIIGDQLQVKVDPEQSAPEPNFSVKTIIVLFLGVGALCIGILLFIRIKWYRK